MQLLTNETNLKNMQIKKAQHSDYPAIAAMLKQLTDETIQNSRPSLTELKQKITRLVNNDGYNAHLAVKGNIILGYCLWKESNNKIYVRQIWIMRSQRNRGIGMSFVYSMQDTFWKNKEIVLEEKFICDKADGFCRAINNLENLNTKKNHTK